MDHEQHCEHEDERPHELGDERLTGADPLAVCRDAQAEVAGPAAQHADDRDGPERAADELRGDVLRDAAPRELAGERQADRHRRIDVVARHVAEGVDSGDDNRAERERDDCQVTDPGEFGKQLDDVRATGLAYENDEAVLGESCVAGAVFDSNGVVGAVGLVVPSTEWPLDDAAVDAVRTTARTISRELGASQWPVPA